MHLVIFSHPEFINSTSMPLFSKMLQVGMKARGHTVEVWQPRPFFYNLSLGKNLKKWQGYLDQYICFPFFFKSLLRKNSADTLYIFADQALGPWVPYLANLPHVIHCHDFMALRSSLGLIKENPTGMTGRLYQKYIRHGFSHGKNFISISNKTRADLHAYGLVRPDLSEVVFNGLNYPYTALEPAIAKSILAQGDFPDVSNGFLLHIGGGQWYKNRVGVVELYAAYANKVKHPKPLWLIGPRNDKKLHDVLKLVPPNGTVHLLSGLSSEQLNAVYSLCDVFIFPSLAEGFGWPIAEAMASGTVVITTNEAPMTEVGGSVAVYIPRRNEHNMEKWPVICADKVIEVLSWSNQYRATRVRDGIDWVRMNFNPNRVLDSYEAIYLDILRSKRK